MDWGRPLNRLIAYHDSRSRHRMFDDIAECDGTDTRRSPSRRQQTILSAISLYPTSLSAKGAGGWETKRPLVLTGILPALPISCQSNVPTFLFLIASPSYRIVGCRIGDGAGKTGTFDHVSLTKTFDSPVWAPLAPMALILIYVVSGFSRTYGRSA